jgi:hypothetical protein
MTSIVFNCPDEVIRTLKPLIKKYRWVIPKWCHTVKFVWEPETDDAIMSATVMSEYREAKITVYSFWLSKTARERERNFVHELIHITMSPAMETVMKLLNIFFRDQEAVHEYAFESWRMTCEGVVEDMTTAITERMNS